MVDICWSVGGGWHRPRVQPYGPLSLDPAAAVLHYGQEIFEGIKAYRHADGSIHTFRPDQNGRRLQRSARRLALPELPVPYFIQSLRELIAVDGAWVPSGEDQSLYLRPFMFAKEAFLGVRPAQKVGYYVIAIARRRLLQGRREAGVDLAQRGLRARRQGRHGRGQDRRQLRRVPAAAVRGVRERVRPGRLPRPGPQRRRARRHERRVRLQGRHDRHPAVRRRSSRASPATRSCSSPRTAGTRSRAARSRSTSGARAWHPATSSRCSPAAPPPSSRRSACSRASDFVDEQPTGELALSSCARSSPTSSTAAREDKHGWLVRLDA